MDIKNFDITTAYSAIRGDLFTELSATEQQVADCICEAVQLEVRMPTIDPGLRENNESAVCREVVVDQESSVEW